MLLEKAEVPEGPSSDKTSLEVQFPLEKKEDLDKLKEKLESPDAINRCVCICFEQLFQKKSDLFHEHQTQVKIKYDNSCM
jgi:hypothetical protein